MAAWTATRIREAKGAHKLVCLTAYDYATARLLDETGVNLILVGDSLASAMLGHDSTLPVTMDQMLYHTAAVSRAVKNALVVGDMPFLSYQVSIEQAIDNAGRLVKESGAGAVKIEGGAFRAPVVKALIENGMPVLGHIGLTPQSVRSLGGYKVQGRNAESAQQLLADAHALDEAGVFALVLECIPAELGARITQEIGIPTIGIGAGNGCDGQILVTHDLLGLPEARTPRFVKPYADLATTMRQAIAAYKKDVADGTFPDADHSYE